MAITSDRLAELEIEQDPRIVAAVDERPLVELSPAQVQYLPEHVQKNIKIGNKYYVSPDDYEEMIALAEDEKAVERAKLNDPDARGFGDTRDPEHTPDASTGSTKQHELTHWTGMGLGRRSYDKSLADQSIVKNRLPLWEVDPVAEEHLYIAATQKPERLDFYRDRAGLGDLPDKEFDAYLQLIIDEYSKLPDPEEMVRGQTPRSTYQYDPYVMPGHELYPIMPGQEEYPSFYSYLYPGGNYPYEEYVPKASGYYEPETDEIVYPLEEKDGGPLYAAKGESLDRIAEIEDEENLQDEENWGTKTAEFLVDMFPSEEKSMGENLFDIATFAVPPAKALKLGKLADPILDTGIMQMKGRQYGKGFSKPKYTKIRGGGKQNTLKTRSPEVWNVYTDIARFSDGGSNPGKLTLEQIEELRKIMPKLRAAASSQTRHGRSTMNNVVRMFDENFK